MGPLAMLALLAATGPDYRAANEAWRKQYEASLRAPQGWLSVAGLFWFREGPNRAGSDPHSDIVLPAPAPQHAAIFDYHAGVVRLRPGANFLVNGKAPTAQALKPDIDPHPDALSLGSITALVIKRGDRLGLRLRDPDYPARRNFTGLHWYPVDEKFRIRAKWHPYTPAQKIAITNVLGMTEPDDCPGYAEFQLGGKTWRLEPTVEDNTLFFTFRDETAAKETYGSGRFLNTPLPTNGEVILDFNQAHNPPCAFTPFATCPLPPKQNHLAVPIPAGEKRYGH